MMPTYTVLCCRVKVARFRENFVEPAFDMSLGIEHPHFLMREVSERGQSTSCAYICGGELVWGQVCVRIPVMCGTPWRRI